MKWTAAEFFRRGDSGVVCTLCPHGCDLAAGELGRCRVRRRRGERLETATFATAVYHLDPIERKPFYHYRPGTRTLTLAAPGCTFRCHCCQNYRLSQYGRLPEVVWRAEPVDPEAVVAAAAAQGASVALSYTEPVLAAELTLALAAAGRRRGVEVVWSTNGFITAAALERLAPHLAAVNLDLKTVDEDRHRELTGAPAGPVLEALAAFVAAGVWVEVSTPLVPGTTDTAAAVRRIAREICRVDPAIPWHLLRYNPEFRMLSAPPTSPAELRQAVAAGREVGLRFVYVERALGASGRATCCPDCGHEVVSRKVGGTRRVELVGGACPRCGAVIPGRW